MAKLVDTAGRPFSGVVPYAVTAIVVDNDDPNTLGRVQVKFPTLSEEPISFWLRQATPNAGKERGLYALPEVDDEVLVIFMQGSQDIGVIIGQFWNGEDVPPQEADGGLDAVDRTLWEGDWSSDGYAAGAGDDAKNDRRFWRSRSGHLIGFDDTKGSETIQIWDSKGALSLIFDTAEARIILSNSKGDIHVRAKNDLFLEAGNDMKVKVKNNYETEAGKDTKWKAGGGHTFESKMDAKHKSGANYLIEATADFKAKGINSVVEGSAKFVGKGAMVEISGSAMVKVAGGVIQLN
jgi:uncharacterized protein involved in type VI secretion and phage assembly